MYCDEQSIESAAGSDLEPVLDKIIQYVAADQLADVRISVVNIQRDVGQIQEDVTKIKTEISNMVSVISAFKAL